MVQSIYFWQFLNILRDILFAVLSIRKIPENKGMTARSRMLSWFFLGMILVMACYNDANLFANGMIRFLYRGICLFLYIHQVKTLSLSVKVYIAILINTICSVNHNFFLSPITLPLLYATEEFVQNPVLNRAICFLILNGISCIIYFCIYFSLPIKDIDHPGMTRWTLLLMLSFGSQYLNSTLKTVGELTPGLAQQISNYILLLQLALLLCLVFVERYQVTQQKQLCTQMENQAAHALLESIETQRKSDNLIRQMRHDLKNHMISIRYLIENREMDSAVTYINEFLEEEALNLTFIKTGNQILDGILIQKMTAAEKNQIDVSISADFSYIRAFDGADLCVLFGNLLDNAIEACVHVADRPRYINMKGKKLGDHILYSIENSAEKKSIFRNNLPITTKEDSLNHGLGLISARRIVQKHHGEIAFSSEEEKFTVILTFPIEEEEI